MLLALLDEHSTSDVCVWISLQDNRFNSNLTLDNGISYIPVSEINQRLKKKCLSRYLTRSESPMVTRNSPIQLWSSASMGCGWSEMVYFRAVTTVLRTNPDSDFRFCWRLGNSISGSTRVSFPTHSATTFLVPSSGLSKCWNRTSLKYKETGHWMF